eukprot:2224469-Rhodomonas_salina.1
MARAAQGCDREALERSKVKEEKFEGDVRCPVLTQRMAVRYRPTRTLCHARYWYIACSGPASAYVRATRCPVLTYAMVVLSGVIAQCKQDNFAIDKRVSA